MISDIVTSDARVWKYVDDTTVPEIVRKNDCSNLDYTEALTCMNILPLADHHKDICNTLFTNIVNDENHRLHQLLPPSYETKHNLRHLRSFNVH